jgi:hypothetical protein
MKYARMLGLAAIAALAITAVVGAGTASASRLCKTTVAVCPDAWDWPTGTEIHAVLDSSTLIYEVNGLVEETCTSSTIKGKTSNTGSATETVEIPLESKTLTGCTNAAKVIKPGRWTIHADPTAEGKDVGAGIVTSEGTEMTIVSFGFISCIFKTGTGTNIGTLDEPASPTSDATLTVNATVPISGAGCPANAKLTAEYTVTTPTPLYVSTS